VALDRAGWLRPSSFVLWIATYRCNFRCGYCEARGGAAAAVELTDREAREFLDDLAGMRVRRLLISGGEPLLRQDLPELLDHARRRSIVPALLSNGFLVRERWQELRRFRYFLYMTSLDGLEGEHDRARFPGSFQQALAALDLFASIPVRTLVVKTLVHPGNIGQLPRLAATLEASPATDWHLSPVFPVGRARGQSQTQLSGEQLRGLVQFVDRARSSGRLRVELTHSHSYLHCLNGGSLSRPVFCGAGLTRCAVMPNGDVLACGQAYDAAPPEGNIRQTPLSQIWSKGFRAFRRFVQPPTCQGCELWSVCQGGCWAERQIRGCCLRDVWLGREQSLPHAPPTL
jgi:radical SAM protein with 4Fe4S-binding SPASM domain